MLKFVLIFNTKQYKYYMLLVFFIPSIQANEFIKTNKFKKTFDYFNHFISFVELEDQTYF
jgi:hypothetical protein